MEPLAIRWRTRREHDIETAIKDLLLLNSKLRNTTATTGDVALERLCTSCGTTADELLVALDKVKIKGKPDKWKSIRKALRNIWSKEEIEELDRRLARLKEELNLHIVVGLREQVSKLKEEQLDGLDLTTKMIVHAIKQQQDIFRVIHDTQITVVKNEHAITRREISQEIRQHVVITAQQQHLSKLPYAVQAAFNSSDQQHDPLCLQHTRVDVLDQIRAWADGVGERRSFWLNGMAGTGKSTIARTIAHEYCERNRLGGSFFFSRGTQDRTNAAKFFTTIAVQMAHISSALKDHICTAIAENNDIANQSFADQWKHLILQPLAAWMAASSQPPLILIIDALDECDDEKDVRGMLRIFAELKSLEPIHLRIFVTSRPEVPIRLGFRNMPEILHRDLVLNDVPREIIDRDIAIYFQQELKDIGLSAQSVKCLIEKACGLFIWAATVCRYINDGKRVASKRLSLILKGEKNGRNPEKELDQIYTKILSDSISGDYDEEEKKELFGFFRSIVGAIVILFNQLSPKALAKLLDIKKQDVKQTLDDLHSVLYVPESQAHPIQLLHPSFRDFLLNKERCQDPPLQVDEKDLHGVLADRCLRLMSNKLARDICGLCAPGALARDIQDDQIEQCLPAELQYACRYWVQHLQRSEAELFDGEQVHIFLEEHLLHWLETLGLMGKVSEGVLAIISLESLVIAQKSPSLHAFINDAKRFALNYRPIIEEAPLQTYYSALLFAPEMSLVRKKFKHQILQLLIRLPIVQKEWSLVLATLEGHSQPVTNVAFSPDGKWVASASYDSTVRLWDSATGALLATLEGHSQPVTIVAFSPDGKWVASTSWDKTVKLWDSVTGASLATLKGHSDGVTDMVFSPDGKWVASASWDKTVRLWDSATAALLVTLKGHSQSITGVAFSPDGKWVASASRDSTAKLWDLSTGASLTTLKGHSQPITDVAFSPDGKWVASASMDSMVRLWDLATGASLATLEGHSDCVTNVAFSPDGKWVASASMDSTVRLWDSATGALLATLKGHSDCVTDVAFSPDGKWVASASMDSTVRLWDSATGALLATLKGHSDCVTDVAFSPNGKWVASASMDSTVKLWDLSTGASLAMLKGHSQPVTDVAFSPDGKWVASASMDSMVRLWDLAIRASLATLEGHSDCVTNVVFSPDGKWVASASKDSTVRLWDSATGAELAVLEGHLDRVNAVAFSPNSKWVASASEDSTARLWDLSTPGPSLATLKGHSQPVTAVAFSPNGKWMASASGDSTVRLWDSATGALLATLRGHLDIVTAVAFSPDGKLVASASGDSVVIVWNSATGAELDRLEGHSDMITAVAFSPDGRWVASASYDKTVRLWNSAMGASAMLEVDVLIQDLHFSKNGLYLETDRGQLDISSVSSKISLQSNATKKLPFIKSWFRNISVESNPIKELLVIKETWVVYNTNNVLWLPPEYRATCSAVRDNTLVLGHESGRITFFEFKPT